MNGVLLDPTTGRPVHRDRDAECTLEREFGVHRFDPRTGRPWAEPQSESDLVARDAIMRAPAHVLEHLHRARELRGPLEPRGSLNTWQETLYSSVKTETALTAAAEAVVYPASSQPNYYGAIGGSLLMKHRTLHLRIAGQISAAATPGTFLWALRWGGLAGAVLVKSGGAGATGTAITGTASLTNSFWRAEFYLTCQDDGPTAASLLATGILEGDIIPTTGYITFPKTAPAAVGSLDTTVLKDLAFTHQPSLATASIAGMQYTLTSLN
jgi:hypothetical protein